MEKTIKENRRAYLSDNSFSQKVILKILESLQYGHLVLTSHDNRRYEFGIGGRLTAELKVNNPNFYWKVLLYGDIGLGEAYMDGDWESDSVEKVLNWLILNDRKHSNLKLHFTQHVPVHLLRSLTKFRFWLNSNSLTGSRKNIQAHYDLSNDFFSLMLDKSMAYSCALFNDDEEELFSAQMNKFRQIAEALEIKSSDHVLEVGSGWGGMAIFLAQEYQARVDTITISMRQYQYVKQKINTLGLSEFVNVKLMDYREIRGKYDKIVSIEMIEAVGHQFMKKYFSILASCLKRDGLLGIQAITAPDAIYNDRQNGLGWLQKYIFPGGQLPSISYILNCANKAGGFQLHYFQDIGQQYVRTLKYWRSNFEHNIDRVKALGFDKTFCRMWHYYLAYSIAAFESRNASDIQIVLTRPNNLELNDSQINLG